MRTRRKGRWLLKQPRLGARMCQGTFFFVAFLYTADVLALDFYIFRIDVIYKIEYHIHK